MTALPPKPESRWFIRNGDHVDGPHPQSRILEWHAAGRLSDETLLSRDGQTWSRVRWPKAPARRDGPTR
jgi:hypothetical protein